MKTDSRFPQILEDKRGLAGGEVVLAWLIASFSKLGLQVLVSSNPSTKVPSCCVGTCSREIGNS